MLILRRKLGEALTVGKLAIVLCVAQGHMRRVKLLVAGPRGWRAVWLVQQERLALAEWGEAGEVYASHVEQGAARLAFDGPLDVPVLRGELAPLIGAGAGR